MVLKRSAILAIMLLYLVTVSGFALNLHFCYNRLSSIKIGAPVNACAKILERGKMKCCKETHLEIKVKDAHQAGLPSLLTKVFYFDVPVFYVSQFKLPVQKGLSEILADRGPPPGNSSTPVYLKNCLFRI